MQHHREEDHGEDQIQQYGDGVPREEGADILQLPHPRDRIPHPARLEVGQRQGDQMAIEAGPQLHVDTAGGVGKDIAAQGSQGHLKGNHHQQPNRNHIQGTEAAVHQHLVHHHLEEERGDQGKELQHQTHHQHFREQFAVLDHGGNKPGEIELAQIPGQSGAGGDQDQAATPGGRKVGQLQQLGAPHLGRLHQHPSGPLFSAFQLGQNDKAAILHLGNGWQRGSGQTLGPGGDGAGLQPQPFAGQQQRLFIKALARYAKLVSQLIRLGGHPVKTGQHHQA